MNDKVTIRDFIQLVKDILSPDVNVKQEVVDYMQETFTNDLVGGKKGETDEEILQAATTHGHQKLYV